MGSTWLISPMISKSISRSRSQGNACSGGALLAMATPSTDDPLSTRRDEPTGTVPSWSKDSRVRPILPARCRIDYGTAYLHLLHGELPVRTGRLLGRTGRARRRRRPPVRRSRRSSGGCGRRPPRADARPPRTRRGRGPTPRLERPVDDRPDVEELELRATRSATPEIQP